VRVSSDLIAPGAVTPWIPVIAPGAAKKTGWWQLPDIGTQVLMAFAGEGHGSPVVIGCVYDERNIPPKHGTKKQSDSKVYQTKNHRMEFIDEDGKESITVSSAKGKMRLELVNGKGINLVNELGDIKIKCRKLKMEGEKGVQIESKKKLSVRAEDKAVIKAGKGAKLECGREVKIKGKNIKLDGSGGITTEGKQLAAEGDRVMGIDVHQMVIPSGNGTAVVPLPHPFIGKLKDKLSKDVKIKGHNAAVKGSVAKHDNPVHNQLPGTIKFQKDPSKDGEVTGGTGRKLKINGKEAAVVGSTVSTCNDIGVRDNSAVLAFGASIPMPAIINPKNIAEYNLEREKEKKRKPEFTNARWSGGVVKEGEKVELNAQVKDIDDGNMVTFQVWKDGQDPASGIPAAQVTASVEGGAAKGVWEWRQPAWEPLPDDDPKYFFTAHSAWCQYKKSENLTIELRRPEIDKKEWQDEKEENTTDKGLAGEALIMSASFNGDVEEGAAVMFRVFEEGADPETDKPVEEVTTKVADGKARADWTYHYRHDPENPLTEKPKYFFTVNSPRCREAESENVEISQTIKGTIGTILGQEENYTIDYEITCPDGTVLGRTADKDGGDILEEDLIPGHYNICVRKEQ
jgi:phage baseplate assembly protein gpV